MAEEAFNRKISLDKQAKHSTQEEIGYVLCLEDCIYSEIWT
jgi:hypothetical protein